MSSKAHKAKIGAEYIANIRKRNSLVLLAEWWSIHITKPAFLKPEQKKRLPVIEQVLKERGVKLQEPKEYRK